jgi:mitochondrial fission 1 protein
MGETKLRQKEVKEELDRKLLLSAPSRQLLEELALVCAKDPSQASSFQYGFALSKSTEKSELRYAVSILDGLVKDGYAYQVDCMYGAATALYLLQEYEEARVSTGTFVRYRCHLLCLHDLIFLYLFSHAARLY